MFKHLDIYICWIHQGCFGDHDSAHLDMAPYSFSPSEQEQKHLKTWDHSFTRKKQHVSLWIMIFIAPFSIFFHQHPLKRHPKINKQYQPQNPGKAFHTFPSILPNKKQELPSKDLRFSRFGVTDPISLGMPTQVGGSTLFFCWVFLVTLKSLVVVSTNENF